MVAKGYPQEVKDRAAELRRQGVPYRDIGPRLGVHWITAYGWLNPAYGKRPRQYKPPPLYHGWSKMKQRCLNPRDPNFENYGGRGITVHDPWIDNFRAFEAWILDNLGPRPRGHSLDRIDNDGNYEPGNLRWASQLEQRANQRPKITNAEHDRIVTAYEAEIDRLKTLLRKAGLDD